jgi:AcrR family transcriptional regulator
LTTSTALSARERIIDTCYELFTRRGICDVGVDEVVSKASVAKATLYRHFPSKDDLVLAFMDRRAELWTNEVIDRLPQARAEDPRDQLLAQFDILDEWFGKRKDYEACSFIKTLFEAGPEGRIGKACISHLDRIRDLIEQRAAAAGLRDPKGLAWTFNILLKGSIVCAAEGDPTAARRAKPLVACLIEQHTLQKPKASVRRGKARA